MSASRRQLFVSSRLRLLAALLRVAQVLVNAQVGSGRQSVPSLIRLWFDSEWRGSGRLVPVTVLLWVSLYFWTYFRFKSHTNLNVFIFTFFSPCDFSTPSKKKRKEKKCCFLLSYHPLITERYISRMSQCTWTIICRTVKPPTLKQGAISHSPTPEEINVTLEE